MTIESSLMSIHKHTDDVTVDYWNWRLLSESEREYFALNHDYIGTRPSIVSLNSWEDLPIPSIQINDLRPQQEVFKDWEGVSHLGRATSVVLNDWLTLILKEEIISPKRAYFLRTVDAQGFFTASNLATPRTYISFFRWRKIIFMLGGIKDQEKISDGDLRMIYAWFESQSPPANIEHLIIKLDASRQKAHLKWMESLFDLIETPRVMPDEAAFHIKLPAKIKEFQFIHRGYGLLYAVTHEVTAHVHPDYHGHPNIIDDYEWLN